MDKMIVCAVALVAIGWWVTVAPGRRAVAVQRQTGIGRSRMKYGVLR